MKRKRCPPKPGEPCNDAAVALLNRWLLGAQPITLNLIEVVCTHE